MKPAIDVATDRARDVATKHGINGHEAALRWTVYHSSLSSEAGDAVIIGASSVEQLKSNLDTGGQTYFGTFPGLKEELFLMQWSVTRL